MSDTATAFHTRFAAPPTAVRPALRWWWPGGAVDADALCAQLRGFAQAGWGGVEIQPCRIGLGHHGPAAVHEVFTPAWFSTVATVMAEARRLGMTVDVTFGSAWPFGGGEAITPELAVQELSLAWTAMPGPGRWCGKPAQPQRPARFGTRLERDGEVDPAQQLPEAWCQRISALEQTVVVLAVRGTPPSLGPDPGFVPLTLPDVWGLVHAAGWLRAGATVDLTDRLQRDGTLDWTVPDDDGQPGQWLVVVVKRFISDQRITEAAGHGPQLVADHLNRAAFDAHAARVGEAALPHWQGFAGSTWRSVFVDSLEIPTDVMWSADFEAEFAQRRGYALRSFLPLLLQPGWRNCFQARHGAPLFDDPQAGDRVRADYRRTVSELMIERTYAPLAGWATQHGLLAKTQAHGAPVDWLQAYGVAGIPETEDLAGGAAPHFLRVARSAAHLYGRPLVTGEAFVWLLEGLAVTPQQLRERADAFFASGIQQLIGHGASAPVAGRSGQGQPAWYPFAGMEISTQLDDNNPLWPALRPLTDYLARCQAVLQRGRAVVPVAVLAPLDLFAFHGAAERLTPPAWHHALQDAGYDWDWLNADALLKGAIDTAHGPAFTSPGGQRYRAIVLPALPALRADVAERLAALAAAGVTVLAIDQAPARDEGWFDHAARDQRVRQAMASALRGGSQVVAPSAIGQALRGAGVAPAWPLAAGHGLEFHVRHDGNQHWLFLRNPGDQARSVALPLAAGQGAEVWHGWTGWRQGLGGADGGAGAAGGADSVRLAVPARSARIVRVAPLADCVPATPPTALPTGQHERLIDGPWQVQAQAQGQGLQARPLALEDTWPTLADLSQRADLADFAGQIVYTHSFSLSADELARGPLWLDLGRVCDAATVQLNDAPAVTALEPPFVLNLAAALRPGQNQLRITVHTRAENALRDPARPGGLPLPGRRLTRLPTGLLGPVRLITAHAPATRWCLPL